MATPYAFLPRNASLSLPAESNITFQGSSRIAPNYHVGPRTYNDHGYVPNPLDYVGRWPGVELKDDPNVKAGALSTAPGGLDAAQGYPHYISLNGRSL
jgi:hypothetical protein